MHEEDIINNNENNEDSSQLQHFGGIENNSLCHILKTQDETNEDPMYNFIKHSAYYDLNLYPKLANNSKKFSILSSNIESINSKFIELTTFVDELNQTHSFSFSAIILQETWLTDEIDTDYSLYQIKGYELIPQGKTCGAKGGLIIYLHEDFQLKNKLKLNYSKDIWEALFIEITGKSLSKNIILGNIYRPPRENDSYEIASVELNRIMRKLEKRKTEQFISGDFNVDLLKQSQTRAQDFFDTLSNNSYIPKITMPTRFSNKHGTIIDNCYCKISEAALSAEAGIMIKKFSDHQPYFVLFDLKVPDFHHPKYITIPSNSEKAKNNLLKELNEMNIMNKLDHSENADPDSNYDILDNLLKKSKDKYFIPKKVRYKKYRQMNNPWMTKGLLKSIRTRDILYKKLKRLSPESPNFPEMKANLKDYNSNLKKCLYTAKNKYYQSIFSRYKNDTKKTWETINNILNKTKKKKTFPLFFTENGEEIHDKLQIANKFNNFFTNIGPKLANKLKTKVKPETYLKENNCHSFKFRQTSAQEVDAIIRKIKPSHSSGIDGISSNLLKFLKPALVDPLTLIINQSIKKGIFPSKLKIAKVIPIYKKSDRDSFNNYRPISLLPSISKVFESVIYKQIYAHLEKFKILTEKQYGFRKKRSTELATLELIDNIIQDMEKGDLPICFFIDLSKAFDTLDHNILLKKLEHYGIKGNALKLFESYLTNRSQYVEYDGVKSDLLTILTGVPQGSVLGPLLFLLYMNDIMNASTIFKLILFADDTTIRTSLNTIKNGKRNCRNISEIVNYELDRLNIWMKANKLSINIEKTKYMLFYKHNKIIPDLTFKINNTTLEEVDEFCFLGLNIDCNLSWNAHIKKISSKLNRTKGVLNKLKYTLPQNVKILLYNAFVLSQINYCMLAWGYKIDDLTQHQKLWCE